MLSVWPQWWHVVGGPRDKVWDFVTFVWPIRSRLITTSSALVKCRNFFGGPLLVSRDRNLCHVQLHPTWFEPTAECRRWQVASNLYNGHLPMGVRLDQGSLLQVGPLFRFPQSHSQWLGRLVGLDLFNDDTRPSGHISRPTQVNVSQNFFHSLNN